MPEVWQHACCRYFKVYLSRMPRTQKVEISVHCDVEVFRWLLQYTRAARTGAPRPALCLDNCMPVLIASHFLQVGDCQPNIVCSGARLPAHFTRQ